MVKTACSQCRGHGLPGQWLPLDNRAMDGGRKEKHSLFTFVSSIFYNFINTNKVNRILLSLKTGNIYELSL